MADKTLIMHFQMFFVVYKAFKFYTLNLETSHLF